MRGILISDLQVGDRVRVERVESDRGVTFLPGRRLGGTQNATVTALHSHTKDRRHILLGHAGQPHRVTVTLADGEFLTQYFAGYSALPRAREDR